MERKNGVWIAELERFGYTLRAVCKTDTEAVNAVMSEYERAFKEENGYDPDEEDSYGDDRSYWDVALDEVYVRFVEFGKVNWE